MFICTRINKWEVLCHLVTHIARLCHCAITRCSTAMYHSAHLINLNQGVSVFLRQNQCGQDLLYRCFTLILRALECEHKVLHNFGEENILCDPAFIFQTVLTTKSVCAHHHHLICHQRAVKLGLLCPTGQDVLKGLTSFVTTLIKLHFF